MPQGARPKVSRQQARKRAQPYASKTRTRVKKGAGIKGGRKNFNDVKGKMMKVRACDGLIGARGAGLGWWSRWQTWSCQPPLRALCWALHAKPLLCIVRPFPSDSLTRFAHRASCFHRPLALIPLPSTRWISQKLTGTIHNNIEAAVLGKAVQAGTRMRMSSLQQTGKDKVREVKRNALAKKSSVGKFQARLQERIQKLKKDGKEHT